MRAGGCAAQQTLSAEAAAVLKHSLSLARRRGHAQVTPLHVAATLLTSRASLLRRACLKSQPPPHHLQPSHHPLQCRALELCFNVALNRLPATPGPLLHAQPSLSNALIAALKRAQAHQRRGCIEQHQQQPPLIAVKVELEQLILSILDDPSVSRVMREAGFSSTAVKTNLDDCTTSVFHCYTAASSGGIYSTPNSPPADTQHPLINPTALWQSHFLSHSSDHHHHHHHSPFLLSPPKKPPLLSMNNEIKQVMEVMIGKKRRRNAVVVGDSSSTAEALVAQLITLVEKGDVPDELKAAQVVKFQFSAVPLVLMSKEEVDMNVADLKRKVDSSASSVGRVIIYIGDLKWTIVDQRDCGSGGFSAVDHLIAEIGKLLAWYDASNMKVWLMATANYQTYVKCQIKQPPLDLQWSLQPVSVPSGGLGLSLNAAAATSGRDSRIAFSDNSSPVSDKKLFSLKEETDNVLLTCCYECTSDYEKEEAALRSIHHKTFSDKESASVHLPYWLKPHANQTLEKEDLDQLRSKYNKRCQNLHQNSHSSSNQYYTSSSYPSWSNKNSIFADSETISFGHPAVIKPNQIAAASTLPRFRRQQSCHIEFSFSNGGSKNRAEEPNLDSLKMMEDKEVKITLALGSSYTDEVKHDKTVFSNLLKENLPWQLEAIPSIMEALVSSDGSSHDKFVLLQGSDNVAKRRLALAAAESMFGSSNLLLCMNMRNNDKSGAENREILQRALRNHEKLVVLVEDVEFADPELAKFLADGFEAGKLDICGRNINNRAIIILTKDADPTNAIQSTNSVIKMKLVVQEYTEVPNLDHKRRAEWDPPGGRGRSKSRRSSHELEEVTSKGLDLNIRADEGEAKEGDLSPISSDLTREITMEPPHSSLTYLKKIKNRFVLNRGADQDSQAREMLLSEFKRAFEEASGCTSTGNLKVEEKVLERVLRGSGLYLNSSFGKWLKDIFQTSLRSLSSGEREKVSGRLCLVGEREGEGEGESCANDGFMGTCLPKRIPVSYIG